MRAAATEFARTGLRGTSTAVIAARAGISQPYVFRFFPSKKRLFIAACEQGMRHVLERLRRAAAGRSGTEALDSMAVAYAELRSRTPWPLLHLQLIAAWSDPELRGIASRMTLQLTECVEALSDVENGELWNFTARILFADPLRSLFLSDRDTTN
ncbi:TetR/AcrR family transcriptional regulator [Streptomyces sp. NPDC049915]|uniref:TetR/AcrR family transcriptional regulator n=1 Tax=Streptomyces sp. NPDC049915 TaxID=3155510 RepID=UPI003431B167